MIELKEITEKVILVSVVLEEEDAEASLDELEELSQTAGAVVCGRIIQRREAPHPGTYLGKGKLQELKCLIFETEANGIVCDDELSSVQIYKLEQELDVKVMDRTLVILDIFAARALSSEGKLQVELAQLRYRAAHLAGTGTSLSRLGGGIGTRGPGEKKLEVDRRRIRKRISQLKRQLDEIKQHRSLVHERRGKSSLKIAALVGYSNVGKSSCLNALTDANILSDDMLFATLDPTTRVMELSKGQKILLTDTVGFIRKLPHQLVEAFRSTLEELLYADIIVHVVDVASPQREMQMSVVYDTLRELGVKEKPVVTLFNKQDRLLSPEILRDLQADYSIGASAKTGMGLEKFKQALEEILQRDQVYIERIIPYDKGGLLQLVRENGQLLEEEYLTEGIAVKAYVPKSIYFRIT